MSKRNGIGVTDLTMFDPERIASELEEASKEMAAFYGLKIPGMSILFEEQEEEDAKHN